MKIALLGLMAVAGLAAQDPVAELLARRLLPVKQTQLDVQVFTGAAVPALPTLRSAGEWRTYAAELRERILREVVFRGEAATWRDAKVRVELLDYFSGGDGFRVRKFRYEVIPGFWLPGHIYEPVPLPANAPVVLNVNGHETAGNATPYIQMRCMNLARKGLIAVNPEWLGRGQMDSEGLNHYRMPQIDMTGTSGIALFFLAHRRALDIAASLPNADPARIAVTGLSGGGWQTIFLAALDTRVAAAMPVAGYSSYVTRSQWPTMDLGDSEQTPAGLAAVADYTHLTALLAPRPALLTHNANDTCCFRADYAVTPLLQAARPVYAQLGALERLGYHVNHGDGHNYDADNREALYRFLAASVAPGIDTRDDPEVAAGVRSAEEMLVPLPGEGTDFHRIALDLASRVKRREVAAAEVRKVTGMPDWGSNVEWRELGSAGSGGVRARYRVLRVGGAWSIPVTELSKAEGGEVVVLTGDQGRRALAARALELLGRGKRVVTTDLFLFGEARVETRDFLFAMLLAGLNRPPLGLQAAQMEAVARLAGAAAVETHGPRTSLIADVARAAGMTAEVRANGAWPSLMAALNQNPTVDRIPELFCFGLMEVFEIPSR